MKKPLLSFHGSAEIKEKYLARVRAHGLADEIWQGKTGQDGKGCAVWCTLDEYSHSGYESELGIPRIIARLEDKIFEGLPVADSKTFPLDFLEAVPVGVNLDKVWRKFLIWLLVDETEGVIKYAKSEKTKDAIQAVALLLKKSLDEVVDVADFLEARKNAYAAYAAYDAAYDAAAAYAYAAYAAAAAADAYAAAAAAADAAYAAAAADAAAAYAADAAAYAADAAAAAADAAAADAAAAQRQARWNKYKVMRIKLIQLLKEAA